ncbi:ferrous iron transport protein A [Candidatus Altiarchaeota archaeon]
MKTIRLSDMKSGEKGRIMEILGGRSMKQQLTTIGLREGKNITVVAKEPVGGPIVVRAGHMTFTIGRGKASKIMLEQ